MRSGRSGFILKETAAVILIVLFLLPPVCVCLSAASGALRFREDVQDAVSLAQLRRILLISYDIETDGKTVTFEYRNENRKLEFSGPWLLISPGTQIILSDIEGGYFTAADGCLKVHYVRRGSDHESVIAGMQ